MSSVQLTHFRLQDAVRFIEVYTTFIIESDGFRSEMIANVFIDKVLRDLFNQKTMQHWLASHIISHIDGETVPGVPLEEQALRYVRVLILLVGVYANPCYTVGAHPFELLPHQDSSMEYRSLP